MDAAAIPLPDSPEMEASAGLIPTSALSSSGHFVPVHDPPGGFFARCRRAPTAVLNTLVPAPVRHDWAIILAILYMKFVAYPASYRYGFCAAITSIIIAEWQQPGCCFPRPQHVTNAIIGFTCAGIFVLGLLAFSDWLETHTWPWQKDGWVWPWQAWLWEGTAYDLGASTNTLANSSGHRPPVPFPTPHSTVVAGPGSSLNTPTAAKTPTGAVNRTLSDQSNNFTFSMPPPTAFKRPIIIPPTPQLPGGLRPTFLTPSTPAEIHKSGILGESPMPPKFKHFSGEGFEKRKSDLQAIAEWHRNAGAPLTLTGRDVVLEKRGAQEEDVHGILAKKLRSIDERHAWEGSFDDASAGLLFRGKGQEKAVEEGDDM